MSPVRIDRTTSVADISRKRSALSALAGHADTIDAPRPEVMARRQVRLFIIKSSRSFLIGMTIMNSHHSQCNMEGIRVFESFGQTFIRAILICREGAVRMTDYSSYKCLKVEVAAKLATVTFNRP